MDYTKQYIGISKKKRINKPYYALAPNAAHFLFKRSFIFDSQQAIFVKILGTIHRLHFLKYAFTVLAG
jgi:hypothetical protein